MEFESVIKMPFQYVADVLYDDDNTSKDVHSSLTDKSHVSPVINSTHDLHYKNLTSSFSSKTSDHFIQNINIVSYHFDTQPHTHEISSKEIFRSIMPTSCNKAFETYFHNDQAIIDRAYTTSPTVGSNVLHVSHENTMWENDKNQGFVLETESTTLNLAMVDSNLFNGPKPNENIMMNLGENNHIMIQAAQIKKNRRLMRRMFKPMKKHIIIKGQWTSHEDRLLVELVEEHGTKSWAQIAKMLHGRVGKQCRERWHNHLRPDIKKDEWTEEEDKILIETHKEIGNKWAEIARRLPGRTENTIKNHWNATKRRQLSRKAKGKEAILARGSNILQNYIRSLTCNEDTELTIATSNANAITGPKNVRDKGKDIMVEVSERDKKHNEEKCKHIFDGVINMDLDDGTHALPLEFKSAICASGSASISGLKNGVTWDLLDEPMTDSWMVMHGCDEIMRKEIALLQLITHGRL